MNAFFRSLALPVFQNLMASLCGAAVVFVGGAVVTNIDGCPEAVRTDLVRGEAALLAGRADDARTIASDILALAPECDDGRELRGKANYALKLSAEAEGRFDLAETYRAECYQDAAKVSRFGGLSPPTEALRSNCKA